jgi:hypothetical protein
VLALSFESADADLRKRGHDEIQFLSHSWRCDGRPDVIADRFGIGNAAA